VKVKFGPKLAHEPPWADLPPEKPPVSLRVRMRAYGRVAVVLCALFSVYLAWQGFESTGASAMVQFKFGNLGINILSESGRCEMMFIRPFKPYMGLFDFVSRRVQVRLPEHVRLSLDTSSLSLWQFGGFELGAGFVRTKTSGDGIAYPPEAFGSHYGGMPVPSWSPPLSTRVVGFPYWFAALAAAAWPVISAMAAMRQAKRRRFERLVASGICPRCRYDLRATPDRCPECGWRNPHISPTARQP
jgi:hypothetical protein